MTAFRVPLTGNYNSRVIGANLLAASAAIAGIAVAGVAIAGRSITSNSKDARYVNCFPQTFEDNGEKIVYCVKRPGFAANTTPQAGSIGTAILVWTGQGTGDSLITAFGGTNSSIYNGITQLVTDNADTTVITGKATGITETTLSGTATLAITSTDNTGWFYQNAGTVTKITNANFPGNAGRTLAGSFVHISGFACVMDTTGRIYASDINSLANWTANSYGEANSNPDLGVGLWKRGEEVLAFGTESLEFWRNAGLTPFPLVRIQEKTVKVGAVNANAITQIGDTVFFAGSTPQGGISVFQYDGAVSRVSSPFVDSLLQLAGPNSVTLTSERAHGLSFIVVVANSVTWVYCIEEKNWHERSSESNLWFKSVGTSIGSLLVTYSISNTLTSGKTYIINPAALGFVDDAFAYVARIQRPLMDGGTSKRKFYSEIELVGDIEPSSTVTLAYTDDDYVNYTTHPVTFDMGAIRPKVTRLGSSRRRGWVLLHSDNKPFRLQELRGDLKVGTG